MYPVSAVLANDAVMNVFTPGTHGSTYGGNPVCCAAGNAVMDVVSDPAFLARVSKLGDHLLSRLQQMVRSHRKIAVEARGRGLWCGLETNVDLTKLPRMALSRGLHLNVIGGKIIRIAPPLVIDQETLDQGLDIVDSLLGVLGDEPTRV
jgi:ornithine--oxo-acid transaminase